MNAETASTVGFHASYDVLTDIDTQCDRWEDIFRNHHLNCAVSLVTLPRIDPAYRQLIIVPAGLTLSALLTILSEYIEVEIEGGSQLPDVLQDDRSALQSYAAFVRRSVESDVEHRNRSAAELATAGVRGITLTERLLLELFARTGLRASHHDVDGYTLCAGTRRGDGKVPAVGCDIDHDKLFIEWFRPTYAAMGVATRQVMI